MRKTLRILFLSCFGIINFILAHWFLVASALLYLGVSAKLLSRIPAPSLGNVILGSVIPLILFLAINIPTGYLLISRFKSLQCLEKQVIVLKIKKILRVITFVYLIIIAINFLYKALAKYAPIFLDGRWQNMVDPKQADYVIAQPIGIFLGAVSSLLLGLYACFVLILLARKATQLRKHFLCFNCINILCAMVTGFFGVSFLAVVVPASNSLPAMPPAISLIKNAGMGIVIYFLYYKSFVGEKKYSIKQEGI